MDLEIKGKKALVLASSQGLGKAIAKELIQEGAETALCSRGGEKLQTAAKEIGASHSFTVDLYQPGAIVQLIEEAQSALGSIDILITNAGGPPAGSFDDLEIVQWQANYQSLFLSVVEGCQAALPAMKELSLIHI